MREKNILEKFIVFIAILFKYLSIWNFFDGISKYIIIIFTCIISIIVVLRKSFNKNELIKIVLLFCCSAIVTFISNEIDFMISLLIALLFCKKEGGDFKLVKYFTISSVSCYIITLVFGTLGIVKSSNAVRLINGNIITRNSLGFEHVNAVFKNLLPIALGIVILVSNKKHKEKVIIMTIILLISYFLYIFTNCRTGFLMIAVLWIYILLENRLKSISKTTKTKYFFLIFTIITFFISFIFGKNENNIMNLLLSNRPYIWLYDIKMFPINIIGYDLIDYTL